MQTANQPHEFSLGKANHLRHEHHVLGFDVAVRYAARVQVVYGFCRLPG